jgi:hypothetical protein
VSWRGRIRFGLRYPLDLCRYLLVAGDLILEVLFQPARGRVRHQPSGSCHLRTMIGRGSSFQFTHSERVLKIGNAPVSGIVASASLGAERHSREDRWHKADNREPQEYRCSRRGR